MKYKIRIFQKHWDVKRNVEFSVDCKWTLKHRSFFQLSIIIKDMSFVSNIDQRIFNSCFYYFRDWFLGCLFWSNNLFMCSQGNCKAAGQEPNHWSMAHPPRFLCHWLPRKIWINLGMTWYEFMKHIPLSSFLWNSNIF